MRSSRPAHKALVVSLLLSCGMAGVARSTAADAQDAAPTAAPSVRVTLEYQETAFALVTVYVPLAETAGREGAAFKKLPAGADGKWVYRVLECGGQDFGLAWDCAKRRLYLDLNRNRDLTDDPAGVFSAPWEKHFQAFTNIHLVLTNASGPRQFCLDLILHGGPSDVNGQAEVRSFYGARAELAGREWQIGLIHDPWAGTRAKGSLLLRPWELRARDFSLERGGLAAFALPPALFLDGQQYGLEARAAQHEGREAFELLLSTRSTPLGELQLAGQYIHRLLLEQEHGLVAVWDHPSGALRLPVGRFKPRVWLQQGETEAYGDFEDRVLVRAESPAKLAIGGPLTNSVQVARRGRSLSMQYYLAGGGGRTYQMARVDRRRPPEFTVRQGSTRLASGTFEFG